MLQYTVCQRLSVQKKSELLMMISLVIILEQLS